MFQEWQYKDEPTPYKFSREFEAWIESIEDTWEEPKWKDEHGTDPH